MKTQASPNVGLEKNSNRVLILPLSGALRTGQGIASQREITHPVGTIQRHCDDTVVVSTDFAESGDYIFFNDCQLLASYTGINKGKKYLRQ